MLSKVKPAAVVVLVLMLLFGFGREAHAIPGGCPTKGATPMNIGPVNPVNGFPLWVQDSTGLTVELCPDIFDPDTNPTGVCIGDPVDPANPFSVQIGFGSEGFLASAETEIDTSSGLSGLLVTGVELAFLNEVPTDGEQFPFTRLRIRVDVPFPGIYRVTHPWGQEVYTVETVDEGQRIRDSFDIEFFANSVHQGRIGPILTWDTFDRATGTLTDSTLVGHIGDLATQHAVTGSPCGTNYFRVEAVGLDGTSPLVIDPDDIDGDGSTSGVSNSEFNVTGKIFTGVAPTPLMVNRTTYSRQASGNGQVDIFATSAPTAGVTFSGGPNLPGDESPLVGDGNGQFFTSFLLTDASTLPSTVNVTASNAGNAPTTLISLLTDLVTVTRAEYDVSLETLTIEANSSDQNLSAPPVLTAFGFGDLLSGSLVIGSLPFPPPAVTVTSSAGGSDMEPVTVIVNPLLNDSGTSLTIDFSAGWSMVSLPVIPDDESVLSIFPDAVVVYGYKKGTGYVRKTAGEDLETGRGYWILFNTPQSYTLTGRTIISYVLPFNENGWDMIGGCSSPAQASVDKCTIDVIYEYALKSGYQRVLGSDYLMPGKGYWILFNNIMKQCELTVETRG